MIRNKKDYKEWLKVDAAANGKYRKFRIPWRDIIWKQLKLLRKYEYHLNCYTDSLFKKFIVAMDKIRYAKLCVLTGISVPPNTFGYGLTIYHTGYCVIHPTVRGGRYVTLQMGVNIAEDVVIGDNVYFAPGVKVTKNVHICENCIIGYNAVVTKSLNKTGTYVGIPAKEISSKGYWNSEGERRKI